MKSTLSKFAASTSVIGLAVIGSVTTIAPAQAAPLTTTTCSPFVEMLVSNTSACEVGFAPYIGPNNDFADEVNAAKFFGLNTWTEAKFNDEFRIETEDDVDGNNGSLGVFDISEFLPSSYAAAMILFKGGRDTVWTAYLMENGKTSGTWLSPLGNPPGSKNTSHISVYTSSVPVPTPALLPGLIGMGVAALRKRKGEAEESAEV